MGSADLLTPALAIGLAAGLFALVTVPLLLMWRAAEPRATPALG